MTQHPFHPSDADRLNSMLDALVSGKRAPDAAASDLDAYAATHRLVSGEAVADASGTPSEDTIDDIWRTIMQVPATVPASTEGFRTPMSARQKARHNAIPGQPRPSRFQSLVSIAAVAAMLIVLIGSAWIGRGGNGPESQGPGRYAAIPLESGTPETTGWTAEAPLTDGRWITPITRADCDAEPMQTGEYVDILRGELVVSERSYEMTGPPSPEQLGEVIPSVRHYTACVVTAPPPFTDHDDTAARSLSTDAYLQETGNPIAREQAADYRMSEPAYAELEMHFESLFHSAYITVLESEAPQVVKDAWQQRASMDAGTVDGDQALVHNHALPLGAIIYNPALAVGLADGRVAVPQSLLIWEDDPDFALLDFWTGVPIIVYILAEEDGQWRVDEAVEVCSGNCDVPGDLATTPEGTSSLPAVTYVHPHPAMCTADPLTVDEVMAMMTDELATATDSARVPVPEMNAATYEDLRSLLDQYLSCDIAGDPFRVWAVSSPDAIRSQLTGTSGPWMPEAQLRQMLEEMRAEIDAAPENSGAFNWDPEGNPAIPTMPDEFDPALASIDEDGRARVTVVWVTRDGGSPSEEYGYPVGAEDGVSEMIFFWDAVQGRWLIDGFATPGE